MSRQSLAALRQVFTVQQPHKTEVEGKAILLQVSKDGHNRIMSEQTSRMGVRPSFSAYANTPANRNIETVRVPGPIVYNYDYRKEIAEYTIEQLRINSPVQYGDYKAAHQIYLNDVIVEELPDRLSPNDVIMISNNVPYSRRIEIGQTLSGRTFVIKPPNRLYERTAKTKVMPRYRDVAKISFSYVELPNAYTIKGGLPLYYGTKGRRKRNSKLGKAGEVKLRKRRQKKGEKIKAPAIFIRSLMAFGGV